MDAVDVKNRIKIINEFFGKNTTKITNYFVRIAIASILEECLDQFHILKALNLRNAIVFETEVVYYKNIHERFTGVENHALSRIPCVSANYDKIAIDINQLMNIIKETAYEINSNGTYEVLAKSTQAIKQMSQDDKKLLEDKSKNRKKIIQLRNKCEDERKANIRTIEVTNGNIQKLRFEVENAIVYGRQKVLYNGLWEKTRVEQNKESCTEKERYFRNIINDTRRKLGIEVRCHDEFTKYIDSDKEVCMNQINYWVKRYDEEIENREGEMIKMKAKLGQMSDTHLKVIQLHKNRTQEIIDWKLYKKERKKRLAREKDIRWASLIVQTWWRGIMARKGLGPYKIKGKGKK